jgi:hypothetical protein
MAKNEVVDLKRPISLRPRRTGAQRTNASHFGEKPHFLQGHDPGFQDPRVVPVYWDPHFQKTPADVAAFDEFLRALFRSSWMSALADYGVGPARLLRSFVASDAPYGSLTQTQLEAQLVEWLASEAVMPRPSKTERSLLYLVITPLSTQLTLGTLSSLEDFSGYHDCTRFDPRAEGKDPSSAQQNLFYAVVPLTSTGPEILDAHSLTISNELAEAFIDRGHWLGELSRAANPKRRSAHVAV